MMLLTQTSCTSVDNTSRNNFICVGITNGINVRLCVPPSAAVTYEFYTIVQFHTISAQIRTLCGCYEMLC